MATTVVAGGVAPTLRATVPTRNPPGERQTFWSPKLSEITVISVSSLPAARLVALPSSGFFGPLRFITYRYGSPEATTANS